MLQVEKVTKSFEGFQAITEANLTVPQGQVVAVIGPNGAGKSTLFNLIMGSIKANSGQIKFKCKDITGSPPHKICRMGIAQSFQLVNVFNSLTVFETVQVAVLSRNRQNHNMFYPAQKIAIKETYEILDKVNLTQHADKICTSMSYGDQKVLEIAVSLACNPELLLLDEPTAGMSPEETRVITKLIQRLSKFDGLTVLLTEHDMEVVFGIAQRIMVLHQGRTIAEGAPDVIRQDAAVKKAYLGETHIC